MNLSLGDDVGDDGGGDNDDDRIENDDDVFCLIYYAIVWSIICLFVFGVFERQGGGQNSLGNFLMCVFPGRMHLS